MNYELRTKNREEERRERSSRRRAVPHSIPLQGGVSLVEVVVGTAILFLALTGLITAYNLFVRAGVSTLAKVQASFLLEEGVEAVTSIRDFGWTANIANLPVGTHYYLLWSGGRWATTTAASTIDNTFSRYFTLGNVKRDANDNIAQTGTADPGTKLLTVVVSWPSGATVASSSVSTYITNLFNN